MAALAELSSIASDLDQTLVRLEALVTGLGGSERDALGSGLYELERTLQAARRRLTRLLDSAGYEVG